MSAASAPLLAEHTKVMSRYRVFCDAYGLSAADQYRLLDLVVERTRRMRNVLIDNANRERYASLVRDGHARPGATRPSDPRVLCVAVFGSLGRGDWRPDSDLDLDLVVGEGVHIEVERSCAGSARLSQRSANAPR